MRNKLIYLDNCCFNRPFDDQTQIVIYLETISKTANQNSGMARIGGCGL
jgi:hypothetical protein